METSIIQYCSTIKPLMRAVVSALRWGLPLTIITHPPDEKRPYKLKILYSSDYKEIMESSLQGCTLTAT